MRKVGGVLLKIVGVATLDRVGGLLVKPLAFEGGHVSQQRLPDQLVSEDQISITLERRNEPGRFGFVEGVDEGVRVHAGTSPTKSGANTRPDTAAATSASRVGRDSRESRSPITCRMLSGTDTSSTLRF